MMLKPKIENLQKDNNSLKQYVWKMAFQEQTYGLSTQWTVNKRQILC